MADFVLGNNGRDASQTSVNGTVYWSGDFTVASSKQIDTMFIYVGNASAVVDVGVYIFSGGDYTLLGSTGPVSVDSSGGAWQEIPMLAEKTVSPGTTYRMGVISSTSAAEIGVTTGSGNKFKKTGVGGSTLPSFSDSGASFDNTNWHSIYAAKGAVAPTVTTQAASAIEALQATLNGNITDTGGENATDRGFYLVQGAGTPTSGDTVIDESGSFGTGAFDLDATSLLENTLYSARAFATNPAGTSVGAVIQFTTDDLPEVTTNAATDKTDTTATLNGEVTDEGGSTLTDRGFYLKVGTTGDPGPGDTVLTESATAIGVYSIPATGLLPNTNYRVAAFATNSDGTKQGATVDVKTGIVVKVPEGVVPAGGTLQSSHPAGDFHNGAESKILQSETNAALITADAVAQDFWYDGAGNAVARGHDDIDYNFDDANTSFNTTLANATENAKNKIATYETARTVDEVQAFHTWAGNGKLLIDVDGNTLLDVNSNPLFSA